ncbi:hypothetical protein GDO78_020898 [Eleutherodactylus coqui]|uniref:Uncharacterized protein n=1 Tax=Eleutherodactylus coqui TaxID=57060 RepID=A0A8J6EHE2_ELECQ|nr:hypothetical protein GDO78_020898 [Eleutherodactylus coqui]
MRFAMKSRRGPHVPVGHNAPKDLREEIDNRLSKVQDIRFEPRLLAEGDERMLQLNTPGCYNYLYRMKTLDAVKDSDIPFQENNKFPKSSVGKNFQAYMLEMKNASSPYKGVRKTLLDTLTEGYDAARCGTGRTVQGGRKSTAPPVCRQRPDRVSGELRDPNHPGDLPAVQPEEQESQTLPGTEELQGQLQHSGEHPVSAPVWLAPTAQEWQSWEELRIFWHGSEDDGAHAGVLAALTCASRTADRWRSATCVESSSMADVTVTDLRGNVLPSATHLYILYYTVYICTWDSARFFVL